MKTISSVILRWVGETVCILVMMITMSIMTGVVMGFSAVCFPHLSLASSKKDPVSGIPPIDSKTSQSTGVDESIIDSTVLPCDDFYQFACGKWLSQASIPDDLSVWDRSFTSLREKNQESLREILESFSQSKIRVRGEPANSYSGKLGNFYAACMDESKIEESAMSQLKEEFKEIEALTSSRFKEAFPPLLAQLHLKGVNAFFDLSDQQDFKNAQKVIAVVDQAGLSLPDRDYYLKKDPKSLEIQKAFLQHIEKILGYLGYTEDEAKGGATKIFALESFLAKNSLSRTDRRDPSKIYHRLERKGLKLKVPHFNWDEYFAHSGVGQVQAINVSVPDFFSSLDEVFQEVGRLEDIKVYLKWRLVAAVMPALPNRFVNESFTFFAHSFSGQVKLEPRWKRCVKMVDRQLGFALSKSFVDLYYGSEGKKTTQALIERIEKSFENRLAQIDWMDQKTRQKAYKKVHTLMNKVGYPDVWRNYDAFVVDRGSYLLTLLRGGIFNSQYHLSKIGKPVDRQEWGMTPTTVNAYYDPSMNEMVFPAGILQPPFFSSNWTAESNFGGIGMVMGHELTHGFDDEGRRYDAAGNLVDWWSPKVSRVFEARAQCMVSNYSAFEPLPGVHLNGKLTLGENIADHGGLRLAYDAWKAAPASSGVGSSSKYTEAQRFFLTFAQSWCSKRREPYARMLATVDPHSPPQFRVNGTVSQFPRFSEAFQCRPGAPMAPVNRCEVW